MEPISERPIIQVKNLHRVFGDFVAVNKLSFSIKKGTIYGFLGPNGAGKSTTIRMLCGILQPTSGEALVAGLDIYTQSEQIKSQIGYMSQKFSLYGDLTAEENIDFYSGIYGVPKALAAERKRWVLEMAGLSDRPQALTADLAGGWKQRLALGCAILHQPPILFLDEPTSGVDPISRRAFWDLIYQLSEEGVTVLVTTHFMEEAEYADKVGVIYGGQLIAEGSPDELKSSVVPNRKVDTLEEVFTLLIEKQELEEGS